VGVPPGEAPLWVREKWVGLELSLAGHDSGTRHAYTSGVLSGPRNRFVALFWGLRGRLQRRSGYAVEVSEAMKVLEGKAPDAAAWWRENVHRVSAQGRQILFPDVVCEPVDRWPAA